MLWLPREGRGGGLQAGSQSVSALRCVLSSIVLGPHWNPRDGISYDPVLHRENGVCPETDQLVPDRSSGKSDIKDHVLRKSAALPGRTTDAQRRGRAWKGHGGLPRGGDTRGQIKMCLSACARGQRR